MSDIRLWSKSLTTELLQIYKAYPCLWKIKSEEYKNKKLKEKAYKILIDFCKDHGMPEANRDFVVKKIQSLKGSFRKELRKVTESQRTGKGTDDIYKPNLWYYDLLLFTKDQEAATDSISCKDEQDDEEFIEEEEEVQKNPFEFIEEQVEQGAENEIQNENSSSSLQRKRKRAINSQAELLFKVCADTLKANSKELSEFDAVGINSAKKLAKMESLQAIYAESLINNVLRRGLLKKLSEDTDLCDRCHRNVES